MNLKNYHSKGLSMLMIACLLMSSSLFYTAFAAEEDVTLSLTVSGAVQAFFADQNLDPVTSHSATMSSVNFNGGAIETATGQLSGGAAGTFVAVVNPTATPAWTVSIAAASPTALWESGALEMDFNDLNTGAGNDIDDDGTADADAKAGKLSLIFTSATKAVCPTITGVDTDNVTLSTGTVDFEEGVTDSIDLATAAIGADAPTCIAIDQVGLSQEVPPGTPASATPFSLVLTLTAV